MTRNPTTAMIHAAPAPSARPSQPSEAASKAPTGIAGLDELTRGGLPRNRTTAIYGGTGVGKTVFAMQCLVHAARNGEPGVFLSFGESAAEMRENSKSLGLDLAALEDAGTLVIDSALMDPAELTPEYTLDGVFVRLEQAIERVGAKHVVIDAVNVISETIPHRVTMRADIRRLLNGLKRRGLTTIITVEIDDLQHFRAEEHLADCVIFLHHSIEKGIATRRLRVVKYRGAAHRANEYPFVISDAGLTLTVVTEALIDQGSSAERVSMGIDGLDEMLAGGVYRGDTVFVTGSAGAGKTSFTVAIAVAACLRGEKCLFVALEEPAAQIIRNMKAIGLDLTKWTKAGLLRIQSPQPSLEGLEAHLTYVLREVEEFRPSVVVLDPLTPLMAIGQSDDVRETIIRLLSIIKSQGITVACTLLAREQYLEEQNTPFASFVDDIILVRNIETDGQRHRSVSVLKARGIAHSMKVRDFEFTAHGVDVRQGHTPPSRESDAES